MINLGTLGWRRLVLACVVVGVIAGGCGGSGKRPAVAATVEGATIPSSDTEALLTTFQHRQTIRTDSSAPPLKRQQLAQTVLGYQIKVAFLEELAKKQNVTVGVDTDAAAEAVDPEAFKAFGLREEDFARSLRAGRLSKAIAEKLFPDVTVSDTALHAEFDRRADDPFRPWKAKVKVARFNAQGPADKLGERVRAGEQFDQVASVLGVEGGVAEVDIDPAVAELPNSVLDALGVLQAGQVSPGVQTSTGWLSILVEHRDAVAKPTFDDLRPELTDHLMNQERARLFEDWFTKQFMTANVKVDGYYGKWNAQLHAVV
jgi:PPIC-type PPIASE domain/SurA N-terminal domain